MKIGGLKGLLVCCLLLSSCSAWSKALSTVRLHLGQQWHWLSTQDDLSEPMPDFEQNGNGAVLAISLNNPLSVQSEIGLRLDWQQADHQALLIIRPLNYRYFFHPDFAMTASLGAAAWQLDIAAMGYVLTTGGHYTISPNFAFALELQYGDKLARDTLLANDDRSRPDVFYDLVGVNILIEYAF